MPAPINDPSAFDPDVRRGALLSAVFHSGMIAVLIFGLPLFRLADDEPDDPIEPVVEVLLFGKGEESAVAPSEGLVDIGTGQTRSGQSARAPGQKQPAVAETRQKVAETGEQAPTRTVEEESRTPSRTSTAPTRPPPRPVAPARRPSPKRRPIRHSNKRPAIPPALPIEAKPNRRPCHARRRQRHAKIRPS